MGQISLRHSLRRRNCPDAGKTRSAWPRLQAHDRIAVVLAIVVLFAVTVPRLPPGVCFSDSGDLQLAAATLGIMHPPGYSGYVTLGWLLTRLPYVNPAYIVSLACLASAIAALTVCILLQVRLGVNAWIASASAVALTVLPHVWKNLVAPEVYAPSLAFLVGAVYLLVRYARLGARRDLLLAATLFGIALANRPTVIWILPFFVVGWWLARRGRGFSWGKSACSFLLATLCAALPGLYSLGYLWVRDTPQTKYNYIDEKNAEFNIFPEASDGWEAKVKRLSWHVAAREFDRYKGLKGSGARERSRWIYKRVRWIFREFFRYDVVDFLGTSFVLSPVVFFVVAPIFALGGVLVYVRCRVSFWLLVGMMAGNIVFICSYNIYGQAADLLPMIFATAVFTGVALSPVFPMEVSLGRKVVAMSLFAAMVVVTFADVPRRGTRSSVDATGFIAELDMQTLPDETVICSTWFQSTALWYAKHVLTGRDDIDIINTTRQGWLKWVASIRGRPVYTVGKTSALDDYTLTRYRNLWRVEGKVPPEASKPAGPASTEGG